MLENVDLNEWFPKYRNSINNVNYTIIAQIWHWELSFVNKHGL